MNSPNNSNNNKIKCPKPDCETNKTPGKHEFQFIGEDRGKMIVVNDSASVIYNTTKYVYKCLTCGAIIMSDIPPAGLYKKIIHG